MASRPINYFGNIDGLDERGIHNEARKKLLRYFVSRCSCGRLLRAGDAGGDSYYSCVHSYRCSITYEYAGAISNGNFVTGGGDVYRAYNAAISRYNPDSYCDPSA